MHKTKTNTLYIKPFSVDFSGQIRIRGFHSLKSRIRKTALKARNHKKDSEDFFFLKICLLTRYTSFFIIKHKFYSRTTIANPCSSMSHRYTNKGLPRKISFP